MTDTTTDDSTTVTPPTTGVGSASNEFRTLLAGIGLVTVIILSALLILAAGKAVFYDTAFNDGFEAGRASVVTDCRKANPTCPI